MKKETLYKSLLILFPVLAVGLATTVDSVTVLDTHTGATSFGSYFSLLDVGSVQLFPPIAALLCVAALVMAIAVVGFKKTAWLPSLKWVSFCASVAAVVPVLLRGDILVLPNVGLPIFMLCHYVVAGLMIPKQKEPEKLAKNRKKK